ncbi:MAG: hypothetical protein QOF96_3543, partial [Actinomycetota bacterium]|nr:hypothetical protein [Actinomycetota bacterium]
ALRAMAAASLIRTVRMQFPPYRPHPYNPLNSPKPPLGPA